jgi:hypothetical protein
MNVVCSLVFLKIYEQNKLVDHLLISSQDPFSQTAPPLKIQTSPLFVYTYIKDGDNNMIKTIIITCSACGKKCEKRAAEINRQKKKGKKLFYCNLKCAGKINSGHLKKYVSQNSHIIKQYSNNRKDEYSPFRYHLNNAKNRVIKYNEEFNLDLPYLKEIWHMQNGKCAVTGIDLNVKFIHTKNQRTDKNPYQASLDRIDNNKGYIKGNVRFVCLMFNIARNNFSDTDVLEFCKRVTQNIS